MIIHTVMGNISHQEYGVASIPFPIPTEDYPRIIEMLKALEVGDVRKLDCHIAEIESPLPVLKCLEDTDVNVDELDYLAKRLDSFSDHELQQFQAMAAKNCYYKLKDLINLTFSCQQVAVISDFSDLEAIGRQHFMNTHYGVTSPELAQQKFRLIALDLLQNDLSAKITPYGVVCENDFWLDEVYDGKRFIGYEDRDCMMELDVMQGNKTAALYLPASEVQIDRALKRCGIQPDEFYNLHIVGRSFGVDLEEYLNTKYETIQSLNSMCEAAAGISAEKLGAIIRSTSPESTEQIIPSAGYASTSAAMSGICLKFTPLRTRKRCLAQRVADNEYCTCVYQLHGRIVHIAQGGHDVRQPVLDGKLRRRAGCEFIINGLTLVKRRDRHFVIVPLVAALLCRAESLIHQLFEKGLVAVDKL